MNTSTETAFFEAYKKVHGFYPTSVNGTYVYKDMRDLLWFARGRDSMVVPEGFALVPINPTEEQFGGLGRSIVAWMQTCDRHSPMRFVKYYKRMVGVQLPDWLAKEIEDHGGETSDHVMPKGTIATLIYKAMIFDLQLKTLENSLTRIK